MAYRDQLLGIADALVATAKAANNTPSSSAAAAAAGNVGSGGAGSHSVPLRLLDVLLQELQKMGRVLEPKSTREQHLQDCWQLSVNLY